MTDLENASYFRARYAEARAVFPLLPQFCDITNNDGSTISTEQLNAGGLPVFNIPPGFDVAENDRAHRVCKHEDGHAYISVVSRLTGVPRAEIINKFRDRYGYSADTEVPGYPIGDVSIEECAAETFANACEGRIVTTKTYREETIAPADALAFFQSLAPAGGQAVPVVDSPPAGPTLFKVIDISAELPFDAANLPWPITSEKLSSTVHWPGGEFDVANDDDVKNLIWAFAEEHIAKDWAFEVPGVQGGAGIMYAEVIAPSGTVFLTRDPDAVLWHSNDPVGNQTSRPILVVCGDNHPPTAAQLRSLRARVLGKPVYPHGPHWTNTMCPGSTLRAFIAGGMEVEEFDMDEQTLRRILREEVTVPLSQQQKAGFNETLKYALRRIARGLGGHRDPFVAYPDDDSPLT